MCARRSARCCTTTTATRRRVRTAAAVRVVEDLLAPLDEDPIDDEGGRGGANDGGCGGADDCGRGGADDGADDGGRGPHHLAPLDRFDALATVPAHNDDASAARHAAAREHADDPTVSDGGGGAAIARSRYLSPVHLRYNLALVLRDGGERMPRLERLREVRTLRRFSSERRPSE